MNKIPTWVWYVAGALGLYYLLKKAIPQIPQAINTALAAPEQAVANAYVGLTSGAPVVPAGNIVLPDGSLVPVAQLSPYVDSGSGNTMVAYAGHTYSLQPHDANGNWPATQVS